MVYKKYRIKDKFTNYMECDRSRGWEYSKSSSSIPLCYNKKYDKYCCLQKDHNNQCYDINKNPINTCNKSNLTYDCHSKDDPRDNNGNCSWSYGTVPLNRRCFNDNIKNKDSNACSSGYCDNNGICKPNKQIYRCWICNQLNGQGCGITSDGKAVCSNNSKIIKSSTISNVKNYISYLNNNMGQLIPGKINCNNSPDYIDTTLDKCNKIASGLTQKPAGIYATKYSNSLDSKWKIEIWKGKLVFSYNSYIIGGIQANTRSDNKNGGQLFDTMGSINQKASPMDSITSGNAKCKGIILYSKDKWCIIGETVSGGGLLYFCYDGYIIAGIKTQGKTSGKFFAAQNNNALIDSITSGNVKCKGNLLLQIDKNWSIYVNGGLLMFCYNNYIQSGVKCCSRTDRKKGGKFFVAMPALPINKYVLRYPGNQISCQTKLDNYCKSKSANRPYARYLPGKTSQGQTKSEWRCYNKGALTGNMLEKYNKLLQSNNYSTTPKLKQLSNNCSKKTEACSNQETTIKKIATPKIDSPKSSGYKYYSGISTPIKCLGNRKLACASNDGRNCFWGTFRPNGTVETYYKDRNNWPTGGNKPLVITCPKSGKGGWVSTTTKKTACELTNCKSTENKCPVGYRYAGNGYWTNGYTAWKGGNSRTTVTPGIMNAEQCANICSQHSDCSAFHLWKPSNHCYIYQQTKGDPIHNSPNVLACTKNVCCPSGYKKAGNGYWSNATTGWFGKNSFNLKGLGGYLNPKTCAQRCSNNSKCVGYHLWKPNNGCYLYNKTKGSAIHNYGNALGCYKKNVIQSKCPSKSNMKIYTHHKGITFDPNIRNVIKCINGEGYKKCKARCEADPKCSNFALYNPTNSGRCCTKFNNNGMKTWSAGSSYIKTPNCPQKNPCKPDMNKLYGGNSIKNILSKIGNKWTLIRHLGANSRTWHPTNDNLRLTHTYGSKPSQNADISNTNFSIPVPSYYKNFTHFLFASGDGKNWLVVQKNIIYRYWGNNSPMRVEASSINPNPHSVRMYMRRGVVEDPWLGVNDHSAAINNKTLVYGERYPGTTSHSYSYKLHKGLNVYVGFYKQMSNISKTYQKVGNKWGQYCQGAKKLPIITNSVRDCEALCSSNPNCASYTFIDGLNCANKYCAISTSCNKILQTGCKPKTGGTYITKKKTNCPNQKIKAGNNGTVSGNTFCKGNWGGWAASKCINMTAQDGGRSIDCNTVPGLNSAGPSGWVATCQNPYPNQKIKAGNNGTVSGNTFCKGNWGGWAASKCINMTAQDGGRSIDCNTVPGLNSAGPSGWVATCQNPKSLKKQLKEIEKSYISLGRSLIVVGFYGHKNDPNNPARIIYDPYRKRYGLSGRVILNPKGAGHFANLDGYAKPQQRKRQNLDISSSGIGWTRGFIHPNGVWIELDRAYHSRKNIGTINLRNISTYYYPVNSAKIQKLKRLSNQILQLKKKIK